VLLVEADLRKPTLAASLGVAGTPGLGEVLRGAAGAETAIGLDPLGPLQVLPAGRLGGGSAGPGARDLDALLRAAARHYDRIVLDAPPVLLVHETVALGAVADACVLGVRWRRTRPPTLRRALTELARTGTSVAGLALTRIDPRRHAGTGAGDAVAYGRTARAYHGA
jgi:Mrp family chromosome partitioning ATPase